MLVGYCKLQETFKQKLHYYQGEYFETINYADFHTFVGG